MACWYWAVRISWSALAEEGIGLAVNGVGGVGDLSARLAVYGKLAEAGFLLPHRDPHDSFY
jgi:hypothetical protein